MALGRPCSFKHTSNAEPSSGAHALMHARMHVRMRVSHMGIFTRPSAMASTRMCLHLNACFRSNQRSALSPRRGRGFSEAGLVASPKSDGRLSGGAQTHRGRLQDSARTEIDKNRGLREFYTPPFAAQYGSVSTEFDQVKTEGRDLLEFVVSCICAQLLARI